MSRGHGGAHFTQASLTQSPLATPGTTASQPGDQRSADETHCLGYRPKQGHFEVDLVHHSGESALGEYGHTLQLIDVATGWSERVMLLGRSYQAMRAAFEQVSQRLPFAIKELHPDNGSEFFNWHLVRFWKEKVIGVHLSRSRPYQKNDNRNVEQKNDTLVRQYFGSCDWIRYEQIAAGNALYEQMWLYYNLFQPVMHLTEKIVEGDKVRRKWDEAKTPL